MHRRSGTFRQENFFACDLLAEKISIRTYAYVYVYRIEVAFYYTGFCLKWHIASSSQVKVAVILTLHSLETSRAQALSSNYTHRSKFLPHGKSKT